MTPEKRLQKDLNLDAMVENLLASDRPGSEISKKMLWAYALNALDLPQRESVLLLLARNERARAMLEEIEQSIARTAVSKNVSTVARVWNHVESTLSAMGRDLSTVAAVIARFEDGLVCVFDQVTGGPRELAAQALMLGDTAVESVREETTPEGLGRPRIDVGEENGLRASVILAPEGLLDLRVFTTPEISGQMLSLFELHPDGRGGEVAIQIDGSHVQRGKDNQGKECGIATFTGCHRGIFRIAAPDGRELTIWCV